MPTAYRSRRDRPLAADGAHGPVRAGPPADPPRHGRDGDWSQARRSKPATYMLASSLKWFASLPPEVRPMALVTKYARIANVLALQWEKPAACRAYFDDLLGDRRGLRQGFPADVHRDLVALRDYYCNRHLTLEK